MLSRTTQCGEFWWRGTELNCRHHDFQWLYDVFAGILCVPCRACRYPFVPHLSRPILADFGRRNAVEGAANRPSDMDPTSTDLANHKDHGRPVIVRVARVPRHWGREPSPESERYIRLDEPVGSHPHTIHNRVRARGAAS